MQEMHRPVLQSLSGATAWPAKPDPWPRAKGVGDTAIRNYNKWAEIRVNMDTLCGAADRIPAWSCLGAARSFPAGPVGAVNLHYSDVSTDTTYNEVLAGLCAGASQHLQGTRQPGRDDPGDPCHHPGRRLRCAHPSSPWNMETIRAKDGAGKGQRLLCCGHGCGCSGPALPEEYGPACGLQSVEELRQIVEMAQRPLS